MKISLIRLGQNPESVDGVKPDNILAMEAAEQQQSRSRNVAVFPTHIRRYTKGLISHS
jgi:hypothetical protein